MITIHFVWLFLGACSLLLIGIIIGLSAKDNLVAVDDIHELINELNIIHCPRCGRPLEAHTDENGSDLTCHNPECGYHSHIEAGGITHKIEDPELIEMLKNEKLL